MAETIPGGAYLADDGKTWHDAEGRPLKKDAVNDALELADQHLADNEAAENARATAEASGRKVLVMQAPADAAPAKHKAKAEVKAVDEAAPADVLPVAGALEKPKAKAKGKS